MNGYVGFWKNKRFEVLANSSYEAQKKIAQEHNIKKSWEITVVLAEKDGKQVTHDPAMIGNPCFKSARQRRFMYHAGIVKKNPRFKKGQKVKAEFFDSMTMRQRKLRAIYKGKGKMGKGFSKVYVPHTGAEFEIATHKIQKNPPTLIYDRVIEIRAMKGSTSNWANTPFKHSFTGNTQARLYGLADGSLLIKGNKRLWKVFDYGK